MERPAPTAEAARQYFDIDEYAGRLDRPISYSHSSERNMDSYLANLLNPQTCDMYPTYKTSFDEIRRSLQNVSPLRMPPNLIEYFHFQDLTWNVYELPGDYNFFCAGFDAGRSSNRLVNACATFELQCTDWGSIKRKEFVKMAGLVKEKDYKSRIVALRYKLYDNYSYLLDQFQFSVDARRVALNPTHPLPTPTGVGYRYSYAGFITEDMVRRAGENEVPNVISKSRILAGSSIPSYYTKNGKLDPQTSDLYKTDAIPFLSDAKNYIATFGEYPNKKPTRIKVPIELI